jgi:N-methylhydantoinase A
MRLGCDTGGTFTDLVVIRDGQQRIFKAPTTPDRPVEGILAVLAIAAEAHGQGLRDFLGQAEVFVHGTTHPLNAVLTQRTARTALVVTRGHRDILTLREGGRSDPFDKSRPFPRPFIPRHLTFELEERVLYDGTIDRPLAPAALDRLAAELRAAQVEAVAVCLLWSIRNPAHELAVRDHLARHDPDLAVSLSSEVNPIIREFRRASSVAIDAALKPLTRRYADGMAARLLQEGLACPFFLVSSEGALLEVAQAAIRPVALINSGPSMAPTGAQAAGRALPGLPPDMIVCDAGGTTFDVSIVAGGTVKTSTENWVGDPANQLFCGFPSVEVLSIGAGGGSIARVGPHGLLQVGPQSAGAAPGPACYGAGGQDPTFTDAALLRGILSPRGLLGGRLPVDAAAARAAVQARVAGPLGVSLDQAVLQICDLATDKMVHAIEEAVQKHGMSPADCTLVGAGGAAGFNIVAIAERLGSRFLHMPAMAPVLSAYGMGVATPFAEARGVLPMRSGAFDMAAIAALLARLRQEATAAVPARFRAQGALSASGVVEARYLGQLWEIDVAFDLALEGEALAAALRAGFDARHRTLFHHADPGLTVEYMTWRLRVEAAGAADPAPPPAAAAGTGAGPGSSARPVLQADGRWAQTPVHDLTGSTARFTGRGPAIIETDYTTLHIGGAHRFEAIAGDIIVAFDREG